MVTQYLYGPLDGSEVEVGEKTLKIDAYDPKFYYVYELELTKNGQRYVFKGGF